MGFKEYERNMSFLDLELSKTLGSSKDAEVLSRRPMTISGGSRSSEYSLMCTRLARQWWAMWLILR